jgi:hypothetical protein
MPDPATGPAVTTTWLAACPGIIPIPISSEEMTMNALRDRRRVEDVVA